MFYQFDDQDRQPADQTTHTHQSTSSELVQLQDKPSTAGQAAPKKNTQGPPLSPRVEGDPHLGDMIRSKASINDQNASTKTVHIIKVQQALEDMGFLRTGYPPGSFDKSTKKALSTFQKDPIKGLPKGTLVINSITTEKDTIGPLTLKAIQRRLGNRQDYVQAGQHPPTTPSSKLTATEQIAADQSLKTKTTSQKTKQTPTTFAPKDKDGDTYEAALSRSIWTNMRNKLEQTDVGYFAHAQKRNKPNALHSKPQITTVANSAKGMVDLVYGKYAKDKPFKFGDNLLDQWEAQDAINQKHPTEKKQNKTTELQSIAKQLLENWVIQFKGVHAHFNASPNGTKEKKIIDKVIDEVIKKDSSLNYLGRILQNHPGVNAEGTVRLQRFKGNVTIEDQKGQPKNYSNLWSYFYTTIHEYIHTLRHATYTSWMQSLGKGKTHILNEGMCEFFTLNVCTYIDRLPNAKKIALKKAVEGQNASNSSDIPSGQKVRAGIYPSQQQAERFVGIVGIQNMMNGYFLGHVKGLGASDTFLKTNAPKKP